MLRLSTNELSGLFSNLDLNFNVLIYIVFFIVFSIIRVRRKIKNEERKSTSIAIDISQEIFSVVTESFLIQSLIQIAIKFILIAIASKFDNYLENKEILLIVLSLAYLIFIVITRNFISDIQYVRTKIINKQQKTNKNNQLSFSHNLDIDKISEKKEKDTEDISEDEPPQQ